MCGAVFLRLRASGVVSCASRSENVESREIRCFAPGPAPTTTHPGWSVVGHARLDAGNWLFAP